MNQLNIVAIEGVSGLFLVIVRKLLPSASIAQIESARLSLNNVGRPPRFTIVPVTDFEPVCVAFGVLVDTLLVLDFLDGCTDSMCFGAGLFAFFTGFFPCGWLGLV